MAYPPTTVRPDHPRPAGRHLDRPARAVTATREPETISPDGGHRATSTRRLSVAAAVLIVIGGYVHLCLYRHGYRFIPKIGVSFLLQASSSALLAGALVVKGGRIHLGRRSPAVAQLARFCAIGLSLGTLAALAIAHTPGGLFRFREIGLRPAPQTLIAIVAESLAVVLLALAMLLGRTATPTQTVTATTATPCSSAARDAA